MAKDLELARCQPGIARPGFGLHPNDPLDEVVRSFGIEVRAPRPYRRDRLGELFNGCFALQHSGRACCDGFVELRTDTIICDDDHGQGRQLLADSTQTIDPRNSGHLHVQDDQIDCTLPCFVKGFFQTGDNQRRRDIFNACARFGDSLPTKDQNSGGFSHFRTLRQNRRVILRDVKYLRTPDERFDGLDGFDLKPNYADVDGMRMHYLDEGPKQGRLVLLLHGEPTWSYVYRHVIARLSSAGLRCIAPDLIGFGRSDKPIVREEHSYANHVRWMSQFVRTVAPEGVVLVCHDWGGLIGLRLLAEEPERFSGAVATNTGLPTGDIPMPEAFLDWQRYSQQNPEFQAGAIVERGCLRTLTTEEIFSYDAPFPDDTYKAGPRQFPAMVPSAPDDPATQDNRRAWESLQRFSKPFLTAFSDTDPITRGGDLLLQSAIPGAKGQPHVTIENAGHFVQEDNPDALAEAVIGFTSRL